MNFEATWEEMEKLVDRVSQPRIVRRILPDSLHDMKLSVLCNILQRSLMLRVKVSAIPQSVQFVSSKGFVVQRLVLEGDDPQYITLNIALQNKQFAGIFTTLIEDITDRIAKTSNDIESIKVLDERLKQWQSFLKQENPQTLSLEEQIGLFGELYFLRDYLLSDFDVDKVLGAWRGPKKDSKDFNFGTVFLEIKTSLLPSKNKIYISSENQLDVQPDKTLFLVHVCLEENLHLGESLPDLVGSVEKILAGHIGAFKLFRQLVQLAGYFEVHDRVYELHKYQIDQTSCYWVDDTFPKIVPKNLLAAIQNVRYSIALAACESHRCPVEHMLTKLKEASL